MGKSVYVHFSFRRPKNASYGIFAVAIYGDEEGRMFVGSVTRAYRLWQNQQYVCAIQSYEHALYTIWEQQGAMLKSGIDDCILVSDNSTLVQWIANPDKRPDYAFWMRKAVRDYQIGGSKELRVNVGLHAVVKYEKSHKFCREELVRNKLTREMLESKNKVVTQGLHRVTDILAQEKPVISGVHNMSQSEVNASNVFDGLGDVDLEKATGFESLAPKHTEQIEVGLSDLRSSQVMMGENTSDKVGSNDSGNSGKDSSDGSSDGNSDGAGYILPEENIESEQVRPVPTMTPVVDVNSAFGNPFKNSHTETPAPVQSVAPSGQVVTTYGGEDFTDDDIFIDLD